MTPPGGTTKTTRPPTPKQQVIIKTKTEHPDLTTRQIAAIANTDHTHVIKTLERYGTDQRDVEAYKKNRPNILAGLQHRLLVSVTDEDIKKAPLGSRILAAAQLYDKERLETGQSTTNISTLIGSIEALQRADAVDNSRGNAVDNPGGG